MTFAPQPLVDLGAYWESQGGANLGIVGNSAHTYGYHVGHDRIYGVGGQGDADYSIRQSADLAGLTDAAAAIDLGHDDKAVLRAFTRYLWDLCLAGHPTVADIREVIGSDDGVTVYGWSNRSPGALILDYGDATHLWHSHLSYGRQTEKDAKVAPFARYFETASGGADMPPVTDISAYRIGTAIVNPGNYGTGMDGSQVALIEGKAYAVIFSGLSGDVPTIWIAGGTPEQLCSLPAGVVDFTPMALPTAPTRITLGPGLYEVK